MRHRSPDLTCRVRRHSTALPIAVPGPDLPGALPQQLRRYLQNPAVDRETFAAIAALQLRLAELASDPEQGLDLIAQVALESLNAHGVAIATVAGQEAVCRARAGTLAPALETPLNTRSGLAAECLRSGEVVCCEDAESDSRVDRDVCRESGIGSVLAVPMRRQKQVLGVVVAFSPRVAAFDEPDSRLLLVLAAMAVQLPITDAAADSELAATPTVVSEPSAAPSTRSLETDPHAKPSPPRPWASAGGKEISKCLDRIHQDPALRLLGRAKSYLTIEALYDGSDRSETIALLHELMFNRAEEVGVALKTAERGS